jgi:hypothetical protein
VIASRCQARSRMRLAMMAKMPISMLTMARPAELGAFRVLTCEL